ncbi:Ppx/GppA family phosphatase [Pontixanthobacter sp.]|uniref:Ppx/GppA family phosphatase n=1 Tax=Pontixanthobacter sp. TaxID=2792078 RepID=UPI003C7A42BE
MTRKRKADHQGAFSGNRVDRAIIDIGSNTVRLVLYGGSPRAPVVLFNEKVAARLGRDIAETGRLADDAAELALRGLRRYALLLDDLKIDKIDVVATAAVREASNGEEFLDRVRALGFAPRLLAGREEARISAMGILGAFPGAAGIVADLGGGSLELIEVDGQGTGKGITLPLGTLRLPEYATGDVPGTKARLRQVLGRAGWAGDARGTLYLVGGTWRAMAVFAMIERDYPLTDPHGFTLEYADAKSLGKTIAQSAPDDLAAMTRISAMRSASLPGAGILLLALLKTIRPERIIFSSWGLREGVLFDDLEAYVRAQDPLLAGVGEFAALRGTPPLLAARVAGWTAQAIPPRRAIAGALNTERLREAATMLCLAAMQIEPNLRVELAIDWALHKRWIDLDPAGRAMIAATVCGNGNQLDLPAALYALASEEQLERALCWGLAIRLCRRLGGRSTKLFQLSSLTIESGTLLLSIEASHADLFGLPTEKDMALLAGRLGLEPEMRIVR